MLLKILVNVSDVEIRDIIYKHHVNKVNKQHYPFRVTYNNIKTRYEWKGMFNDIKLFINNCECKRKVQLNVNNRTRRSIIVKETCFC